MAAYRPLALMAADADDLKAISVMLQDAIVKIGDMTYLQDERRFVFMANRYCWEAGRGFLHPGYRVRTGIHFDDVQKVRAKSVRLDAKEALIDVLSIEWEGDENGGCIKLSLAGGGTIALETEAINVTVKDVSEPWRASRRPDHDGQWA